MLKDNSKLVNNDTPNMEYFDKVYTFPMNKGELQQAILLCQDLDKKLGIDEIQMFFL